MGHHTFSPRDGSVHYRPVLKPDRTFLVRSAQAGDELAFADLVRSHQDRAVAYATAILGDYHLA